MTPPKTISFFVEGRPVPGGSKTPIPIYRGSGASRTFTGHVATVDASEISRRNSAGEIIEGRGKVWKHAVKAVGLQERLNSGWIICDRAMVGTFSFHFCRPKKHFGTGKNAEVLKPNAWPYPISPPDVLKLTRSVEDALKGILYVDDSLIVRESISKEYVPFIGAPEGVLITLEVLD